MNSCVCEHVCNTMIFYLLYLELLNVVPVLVKILFLCRSIFENSYNRCSPSGTQNDKIFQMLYSQSFLPKLHAPFFSLLKPPPRFLHFQPFMHIFFISSPSDTISPSARKCTLTIFLYLFYPVFFLSVLFVCNVILSITQFFCIIIVLNFLPSP